jgi:hypothetical protein
MVDARTPLERLDVAANLYSNACEDRDGYMADLKRCIRECGEAGIPKLRIAQIAGVSRQTVYDAIRGDRP